MRYSRRFPLRNCIVLFLCIPLTVSIVLLVSQEVGASSSPILTMTTFLKNVWKVLSGSHDDDDLPKYPFPETIEEFGYVFNDKGQLVNKEDMTGRYVFNVREDDRNYNQQHYDALGEAITEYLYGLMEKDLKLERVFVPVDAKKEEPQSFIFRSENAMSDENLMVLIHGAGVVRAGQWSRKLIMNEDIDTGSQLPYIRRALEEGYGVIVMNTNLNQAVVNGKPKDIRDNSSPEKHGLYVWKHFISEAKAKNIAVVAHSYGGIVACTIAEKYLTDFKERVFSVVFTDSVHGTDRARWPKGVKEFMKERAVNFASTYVPLNFIMQSSSPDDVISVSAGTKEHERTSHASIESAFKFIRDNYESWIKDGTMAEHPEFQPLPEDLSMYSPAREWERKSVEFKNEEERGKSGEQLGEGEAQPGEQSREGEAKPSDQQELQPLKAEPQGAAAASASSEAVAEKEEVVEEAKEAAEGTLEGGADDKVPSKAEAVEDKKEGDEKQEKQTNDSQATESRHEEEEAKQTEIKEEDASEVASREATLILETTQEATAGPEVKEEETASSAESPKSEDRAAPTDRGDVEWQTKENDGDEIQAEVTITVTEEPDQAEESTGTSDVTTQNEATPEATEKAEVESDVTAGKGAGESGDEDKKKDDEGKEAKLEL